MTMGISTNVATDVRRAGDLDGLLLDQRRRPLNDST
jgi:hypothetical protein